MTRIVPGDARLEIKFVSSESEQERLVNWLRLHSAGFVSPYAPRWINNVYFDTHDYASFRQNLAGASQRLKVRYRWYGYDIGLDKGSLELKCKRNFFGWKRRFAVDTTPCAQGDGWRDVMAKLTSQLPQEARAYLHFHPQPAILTRYKRQYFVSGDQKVRATIDTHQSVYDQRYKPYPNTTHRSNIRETLVLEIKFDRDDREFGASLMQGLPIRVSRNSKYVLGMRAAHGF